MVWPSCPPVSRIRPVSRDGQRCLLLVVDSDVVDGLPIGVRACVAFFFLRVRKSGVLLRLASLLHGRTRVNVTERLLESHHGHPHPPLNRSVQAAFDSRTAKSWSRFLSEIVPLFRDADKGRQELRDEDRLACDLRMSLPWLGPHGPRQTPGARRIRDHAPRSRACRSAPTRRVSAGNRRTRLQSRPPRLAPL